MLTVGLLIVSIGFATVEDYGVSWDEGTEVTIVQYNLDWITQSRPIPRDLQHDGLVFNGTAELLFQARQFLAEPFQTQQELAKPQNDPPNPSLNAAADPRALAQRIRFKHRLTFLWSLAAYSGVLLVVSLLAGMRNAWFAAVVLALMPRFWAHSFFNPKDLPFASLLTLTTALGALLLGAYHQATTQRWGGPAMTLGNAPSSTIAPARKLWCWAAGYGLLLGLLGGVRLGGWLVLGVVGLAHVLTSGWKVCRQPRRLLGFYGAMGLGWVLMTIAVYPAAWPDPLGWFWQAHPHLLHPPWDSPVLFQGDYWQAAELPWSYFLRWVSLTVPTPWLLSAGVGLALLALNYRNLTPTQRAGAVLVLGQALGLPLVAILTGAPVYGGMRQFLFVLPAIAAIAAWGLLWSYQQLIGRWRRFIALTLLVIALSPIVVDMITLHPYQSVYFNRLSGGLQDAYGQYDIDYWGLSLREAVTWLNGVANAQARIAMGGPQYIGELFVRPDLTVVNLDEDLDYGAIAQPDYYISMVYLELPTLFAHCPTVHQVQRQGVPLAIVKDCTDVEFQQSNPQN